MREGKFCRRGEAGNNLGGLRFLSWMLLWDEVTRNKVSVMFGYGISCIFMWNEYYPLFPFASRGIEHCYHKISAL